MNKIEEEFRLNLIRRTIQEAYIEKAIEKQHISLPGGPEIGGICSLDPAFSKLKKA